MAGGIWQRRPACWVSQTSQGYQEGGKESTVQYYYKVTDAALKPNNYIENMHLEVEQLQLLANTKANWLPFISSEFRKVK